eukprot:2154571-Rhodomonas_salina.2
MTFEVAHVSCMSQGEADALQAAAGEPCTEHAAHLAARHHAPPAADGKARSPRGGGQRAASLAHDDMGVHWVFFLVKSLCCGERRSCHHHHEVLTW